MESLRIRIELRRLFAWLLDVVYWLAWNNHWCLVAVGSVMLFNWRTLLSWTGRDYSAVQRIVLVQANDFHGLAMGSTFGVRCLVLDNSHTTGFHCNNVIRIKKKKHDSEIVMSWICRTENKLCYREYIPAGARPATFCLDSSSDILNACYYTSFIGKTKFFFCRFKCDSGFFFVLLHKNKLKQRGSLTWISKIR